MRGLLTLCLFTTVLGCSRGSTPTFDLSQASFVGKQNCISCHQEQDELHAGSHHDLAMQLATEKTVLGDFDDATQEHHGIVSRFYRDGDKYMVRTEGPDGQMGDFHVKYVFGVEPLQQYMVELPQEREISQTALVAGREAIPRVQVLRLSWDTEKEAWFYLPPPDVEEKLEPDDDLHWTGVAQRWNNMCADCHSTDFRKEFVPPDHALNLISRTAKQMATEAVSDNSPTEKSPIKENVDQPLMPGGYHSNYSEIDVSCESCHGPGSVHVELAKKWFPGWSRERGYGLANLKLSPEHQIQSCAPCHSRRNVVQGGFQAGDNFYDFYSNQLLTAGIYYPDGQILDEDYVHGSFIQSKMYHKGIKCSDCHDPHTARLIHDGNQVCTSCHQHPAAKYDSVAHHFHKPGSDAAKCVSCHMPTTTYMEVDARRDHSFRIPRPDLSTQLETPNACTGCHLEIENVAPEKSEKLKLYQDWMQAARDGDLEVKREIERVNQWCDEACEKWYGEARRRDEHFGIAIAAGQSGEPDAVQKLRSLLRKRGYEAPAIARATALQVLSQLDPESAADEAARAADDDHPLVRTAAMAALANSSNVTRSVSLLQNGLSDPVRCVRTEAARNLLEYPPQMWKGKSASAFRNALEELQAGLEFNNDRAGAHLALGVLAEQQGRDQQAIKHYQTAIAVEPQVTGPRTNLAALLERNLSNRIAATGGNSDSLRERIDELRRQELPLLKRDAALVPEAAGIQYRLGLALYVAGQQEEAIEHLLNAAELEPRRTMYAQAVTLMYESMSEWPEALKWARRTVELEPQDQGNLRLLEQIKQSASSAQQAP